MFVLSLLNRPVSIRKNSCSLVVVPLNEAKYHLGKVKTKPEIFGGAAGRFAGALPCALA